MIVSNVSISIGCMPSSLWNSGQIWTAFSIHKGNCLMNVSFLLLSICSILCLFYSLTVISFFARDLLLLLLFIHHSFFFFFSLCDLPLFVFPCVGTPNQMHTTFDVALTSVLYWKTPLIDWLNQ